MTDSQKLEIDWPVLVHRLIDLALPRSDDILDSPAKLGELLTVCTEFAEIEPIVRERAATLAMQKKDIVGWTLVHRDGNRYVEAQRIIELCLHCPVSNLQKLLTTMAMQAGNTSERRYQELCESTGLVLCVEAVKQTGATVHLRRDSREKDPINLT
jgi:hypothetical protein